MRQRLLEDDQEMNNVKSDPYVRPCENFRTYPFLKFVYKKKFNLKGCLVVANPYKFFNANLKNLVYKTLFLFVPMWGESKHATFYSI